MVASMAVDCAFYTVWLHELGDIQSMDQPGQDDGPYATLVAEERNLRDGTLAFEARWSQTARPTAPWWTTSAAVNSLTDALPWP